MKMNNYANIDDYISNFPDEVQANLQKLRQLIKKEAPSAQEKIAYGIPTFALHGNLVHFAAYETHYGFYPGSSPIEVFAKELKPYDCSKGTIRFPLNEPMPWDLIRKIISFRVKENLEHKKK